MNVVVLAGGTGGAKLAAGMQDIAGSGLTVIANSGDDIEILGVHVSPDPDLCSYWLSGEIDEERGWGIAGDSFTIFERLVELGAPDWFGLSDRDLALCLRRRVMLDAGLRPTEAQLELTASLGTAARVLPMCDDPVRTRLRTADGWRGLQEYLIREHGDPEVHEVEFAGIEAAVPSPEVSQAIAEAEAIVIGPSNPVISIGPILAVPGMVEKLREAAAPVVAVSPFVAGHAVKGPTEELMRATGSEPTAAGVAALYAGVIDGIVVDAADPGSPPDGVETLAIDTLMEGAARRREVGDAALGFCLGLAG